MALTNPKIFGLNIKSELSDVKNKNTALINLGLNPLDLEIIKGSANSGMSRYDWFSFSRLTTPIYKTLSRFSGEASLFSSLLTNRAGTDQTLFGNLDINGSLSGSAIRYRFLDVTRTFKLADISTSRVSAWSSSDPRANNQNLSTQKKARISYGARVSVVSGGQLQFGQQSTATQALGNDTSNVAVQRDSDNNIIPGPAGQPRLQTTIVPEEKEFASEVPTSKIKCNINGSPVFLYAMKGIPLVFKGFFRNLNASVSINYTQGGSIPASWKIVETGNPSRYTNFANRGTGTSSIAFRSPVSRERFIKFYYNPKHITQVQIRSANIRELPATRLENCTSLDFAYNQLKLFPNVSFVAPKINTLSLMRNPFYLSDNEFERKFNNLIMEKIKTPNNTLRTLNMEGTFYGSIERHLIPVNLPNLTSLNLGRGGGAYFHADDKPDSGLTNNSGGDSFCPDIPEDVTSYNIVYNRFSSVDLNEITSGNVQVAITDPSDGSLSVSTESLSNGSYSFKKAPNLTDLNVTGNTGLTDAKSSGNFDLASKDKLVNIGYSATGLGIANMQNSPSLKSYNQTYAYGGTANPLVSGTTYRFDNCSALESLSFYATNLGAINFPTNFSNPNLVTLDLRYTNIKGGAPGNENEVITNGTFFTSPSIQNIYIDSGNLLAKPINVDAFKQNPNLGYFWFRSYGRVSGSLPDFSANPSLHHLWIQQNAFTGSLPNFGNNQNIHYVNVTRNNFTGTIPAFTNLSNLRYLFLQNNSFTGIGEPNNLPNLWYYYAHNNQIAGEIPDFTTCTNLRYLTLYNNQLSAYKVGSFKSLYRIRYFDLSNNNLNQTTQDNILLDLYDNWNAIKRGGVTVNLRGNKNSVGVNETPSDEVKEKALILVQNGWNISVNGGLS
jgi:Leucine-rich repeat (LRR) protein